jgi:hypothetical protein
MIYTNRELNSYLTHLTLVGQDEDGRLEYAGNDEQWYNADIGSYSDKELEVMEYTAESDRYDLSTCHTK